MHFTNFRKAEERRKKGFGEMLPFIINIALILIIVIILVLMFAFWKDLTKPAIEIEQLTLQQLTVQKETLEIVREIKQDIQVIEAQNPNGADDQPN
jgi:uncharacterized protein YpmB